MTEIVDNIFNCIYFDADVTASEIVRCIFKYAISQYSALASGKHLYPYNSQRTVCLISVTYVRPKCIKDKHVWY